MKIDLTKEEWEFLRYSIHYTKNSLILYGDDIRIEQIVSEKLGSEWVDDET